MTKLELYQQSTIINSPKLIKANNAFILDDGSFYLAKGYTGGNFIKQIESSSLMILRELVGYDIKRNEVADYFNKLGINYRKVITSGNPYFYYLKQILVDYYGYALFARREDNFEYIKEQRFSDCSATPNPAKFNKKVKKKQLETLKLLIQLNDSDPLCIKPECTIKEEVVKGRLFI
ncbi:MAG: hypothetical protein PHD02_00280 [Bacilli bacterium]|nr:hypothetical protein [Bacilli bacterium]